MGFQLPTSTGELIPEFRDPSTVPSNFSAFPMGFFQVSDLRRYQLFALIFQPSIGRFLRNKPGRVNDHMAIAGISTTFNRKYIDSIRGPHFPASYVSLPECIYRWYFKSIENCESNWIISPSRGGKNSKQNC